MGEVSCWGVERVMAGLSPHPVLSQCQSPGGSPAPECSFTGVAQGRGMPAACRKDRGGHQALATLTILRRMGQPSPSSQTLFLEDALPLLAPGEGANGDFQGENARLVSVLTSHRVVPGSVVQ